MPRFTQETLSALRAAAVAANTCTGPWEAGQATVSANGMDGLFEWFSGDGVSGAVFCAHVAASQPKTVIDLIDEITECADLSRYEVEHLRAEAYAMDLEALLAALGVKSVGAADKEIRRLKEVDGAAQALAATMVSR